MKVANLPVVCNLTEPEIQARRIVVLQRVGRAVLEVIELENGYAYCFPSDDKWLDELINLIRLERQCSAFLTFKITVVPGDKRVWLELTGPQGTKEFLSSFLN